MVKNILKVSLIGIIGLLVFPNMAKAEEYSELYSKMFSNGKYEVKSIPVTNDNDADVFVYGTIFQEFTEIYGNDPSWQISMNDCNSNYTSCTIKITHGEYGPSGFVLAETDPIDESHVVTLTYESYDPAIKTLLDGYTNKISQGTSHMNPKLYTLSDLNLINYYLSFTDEEDISDMNNAINFSTELRKEFDNANISYRLDVRAGNDIPLNSLFFGYFVAKYNGVYYSYVDPIGIQKNDVIYIPDDTPVTTEAYIAAAKKRIEDYVGNNVEVTVGGLRSEIKDAFDAESISYGYDERYDFSVLGDESKMGDYYYNVKLNNRVYKFIFLRDSEKMENCEFLSRDLKSMISVSSKDAKIPLDTVLKTEIISDTTKYENILDTDNVFVVDIKLNSMNTGTTITKLENGKFLVSIPVPKSMEGKTIKAYYINSAGEKEEHVVTVKDNIASFETDHFSTYALAEVKIDNPNTGDNIMQFIILGSISIIGLVGAAIYCNRKKCN